MSRSREIEAAEDRVAESRRRVQARLAEIATAADREVQRARAVKDAGLALLGVVGVLVGARRVARAIGRKRKRSGRSRPESQPAE